MKKNLTLILTVIFLSTVVAGCNAFKGAGKDIENAGKGIQKTVEHND